MHLTKYNDYQCHEIGKSEFTHLTRGWRSLSETIQHESTSWNAKINERGEVFLYRVVDHTSPKSFLVKRTRYCDPRDVGGASVASQQSNPAVAQRRIATLFEANSLGWLPVWRNIARATTIIESVPDELPLTLVYNDDELVKTLQTKTSVGSIVAIDDIAFIRANEQWLLYHGRRQAGSIPAMPTDGSSFDELLRTARCMPSTLIQSKGNSNNAR